MSTLGRRRNRSLASCEPCRKSKIRCDHGKPTCASCHRRGLRAQCWYHPAPLTKNRTSQRHSLTTPPISVRATRSAVPSYLPVESPLAETPKFHSWPFMPAHPSDSSSLVHPSGRYIYNLKAHNEHLAAIQSIVSQLKLFPLIEKHLHEYYSFSLAALVPRPLLLQLITSVRAGLVASGCAQDGLADELDLCNASQLAEDILRASATEVVITRDLDPPAFCVLFCGPNLRIETLGLLYTMAARASLCAVSHGNDEGDDAFVRDMGWYGNLSLRLARELAPQTTDLIIWLAHENLQLTTIFEGDASLGVWRRLSDLATDVLALGLNREATHSATPIFLAECRRRTFAKVYYLDKLFASVFNRPPRLTARHVDCNAPLDLSDEELFASSDELEKAKRRLTQDGWNTDGKHSIATWARIRLILAEFREETVEYQLRAARADDAVKLRELSHRCTQAWNSLPSHLQYGQGCLAPNLSPELCHMHAKIYLSYLHIHFQIFRLLGNVEGDVIPQPDLLEVSANMLDTIIQMTNCRGRASFSPRDLPGIVLSYGLPCAAILSTALEDAIQDASKRTQLPPGIKTSHLIRKLSVLLSQLEVVSNPSETNHIFCLNASKAISRKLDRILDGFTAADVTKGSVPSTPVDSSPGPPVINDTTLTEVGDSFTTGFVDFDTFNLSDWTINFDIGISDELKIF
ncbi:uncharacterized protein BP01DRAFT_376808 [Aspergillus saccharolyticus JOP 1030-1]|uniref:Zn(2)-C6 fungal-type domain-containing protein n=1 Tax=Aspergillus saccharolyticus JOP 1030-1 TaxID=1450539 RepID=A0A318Z3X4_9EURO|nr:hypothetical protein BP01DRAFT_376808 [Aspergillus saccharolyticus JOP 1030-1]PYH41776.1 hypothetical protein BP01DRAFT_376808 [Aspergillus saccharolyticus JOP 1030-1]